MQTTPEKLDKKTDRQRKQAHFGQCLHLQIFLDKYFINFHKKLRFLVVFLVNFGSLLVVTSCIASVELQGRPRSLGQESIQENGVVFKTFDQVSVFNGTGNARGREYIASLGGIDPAIGSNLFDEKRT